jgi:hypothetical protein
LFSWKADRVQAGGPLLQISCGRALLKGFVRFFPPRPPAAIQLP